MARSSSTDRFTSKHRLRLVACIFGLFTTAGCSSSGDPELVPAGGVLIYRSQPLENVTVIFIPAKGPLAHTRTKADGTFRLATGTREGIVVGPATVILSAGGDAVDSGAQDKTIAIPPAIAGYDARAQRGPESQAADRLLIRPKTKSPGIPSKYASVQTSGLVFTVDRDSKNEFRIELAD